MTALLLLLSLRRVIMLLLSQGLLCLVVLPLFCSGVYSSPMPLFRSLLPGCALPPLLYFLVGLSSSPLFPRVNLPILHLLYSPREFTILSSPHRAILTASDIWRVRVVFRNLTGLRWNAGSPLPHGGVHGVLKCESHHLCS